MGEAKIPLLFSIFLLCLFSLHAERLQTYIVQLHPDGPSHSWFASRLHWHLSFIDKSISTEEDSSSRLLYSYSSAMEGFAAQLSAFEVEMLKKSHEVVAVRPDRRFDIHTTYSYKFLGLSPTREGGAWMESGFGRGSIIGLLDTGVWPESPSFDDRGMPPVPRKWKGICQEGQDFNASSCNRKLIGARYFSKGHRVASLTSSPDTVVEYVSPRDSMDTAPTRLPLQEEFLFQWQACLDMEPVRLEEWPLVHILPYTKSAGSAVAIVQTFSQQWM
ncbi:UNVERIFIED_CONTAM: Subtilisin-like protease SBT1.2 [Sesamum calycinum]|uniref:Subtilisin-like protease SBT1.2 n=1 Tax=Sesamum calycinum TaxID=2727403 RepID=A0AAW2RTZ9_9LAMI